MPLARAKNIPRKHARALILDLARYGDNSHRIPPSEPDTDIIAWFEENKQPFDALIEKVRDPNERVPIVSPRVVYENVALNGV